MTEKQSLSSVENGRVIGVVTVSPNSGLGEPVYILLTAQQKPIFGRSPFGLTLGHPIRGSVCYQWLGTVFERLCSAEQESGLTLRLWSVIPKEVISPTFTFCPLRPAQWSGSIYVHPSKIWLGSQASASWLRKKK